MSEMDSLDDAIDEISIEAPEADTVEQHQGVRPSDESRWPDHMPFEADPADVADQEHEVGDGDDDYR